MRMSMTDCGKMLSVSMTLRSGLVSRRDRGTAASALGRVIGAEAPFVGPSPVERRSEVEVRCTSFSGGLLMVDDESSSTSIPACFSSVGGVESDMIFREEEVYAAREDGQGETLTVRGLLQLASVHRFRITSDTWSMGRMILLRTELQVLSRLSDRLKNVPGRFLGFYYCIIRST